MNSFAQRALFATIASVITLATQTLRAEGSQLFPLVKDLQIQQAQIAENQTKIDTKISDLAETIRMARIYASRLGGEHKRPPIPNK
jgi:hypothetical protein